MTKVFRVFFGLVLISMYNNTALCQLRLSPFYAELGLGGGTHATAKAAINVVFNQTQMLTADIFF